MSKAKPYSVNLGPVDDATLKMVLQRRFEAIDRMFIDLYQLAGTGSGGGGLTSVVNDTNVTGTLSNGGATLTLGWSGTLSAARGGYSDAKVYARMSLRA